MQRIIPNEYYIFNVDFWSMDHVFFICMSVCTWIYTIGANFAIYEASSLYAAIAGSVTSLLQTLLFCASFMGMYQSIPDTITWISVVVTAIASLIYAVTKEEKNKDAIKQSWMYRLYS